MSVRVYMDMCALKRPFDDLTNPQILIDAIAVDALLQFCRGRGGELVGSDTLFFENSRNPNPIRRALTAEILNRARTMIRHSPQIDRRALELVERGIGLMDALHVASAEAGADWLCTTDRDLITRARVSSVKIRVLTPAGLLREVMR